jgi:hypothetical protein
MSSEPSIPPFPDATHVSADTPCVTCGYNLRTLALDGVCPECATPVWDSLHGFYLHYAAPAWVRGLARGLLLTLCACGAMVLVTPVIMLITGVWGFLTNPGSYITAPTTAIRANALTQFLVQSSCTGLMMLGLLWLSRPDPRGRESAEVARSRHVLRSGTWLLPLPVAVNVLLAWALPTLPQLSPGAPPPPGFVGPWMARYTALGFLTGVAGLVIYGVTALALLRRVAHLALRIPRPKLARAARISFWGLLASVGLMAAAYAAMFLLMMPMMSTLLTAAGAAATTAPTTTSSVQLGPLGPSVQLTNAEIVPASSGASGSPPGAGSARRPTSAPAGSPASGPTTFPATLPAPGMPFFAGAFIGGCGGALGGCGSVVFGIAVVVILIRACSALFAAARAAQTVASAPNRAAIASAP